MVEIEEKLLTLLAPQLNDVCAVKVNESERDLPRKLRRLILQCLEGNDVTSMEDRGMSELNGIKEKNAENNEPQAKQTALQHRLLGEYGTTPNNPDEESEYIPAPNNTEPASVPVRNPTFVHPLYRRDLKIVGQIGEPNQKDKLRYASLERQMGFKKKDMMRGKLWRLLFKL